MLRPPVDVGVERADREELSAWGTDPRYQL
jgi:hypothetical protein